MIKILAAPAKAGGKAYLKLVTASFGVVVNVFTKVLGAQLLKDVQAFIAALDTMFGGFRERADATYRLLKNPETRFLVVAAPERDALREASYFVERLSEESMPLAGLVLNRVHRSGAAALSAGRSLSAAEDLDALPDGDDLALPAALLRLHADRMAVIAREERMTERFTSAHPSVAVGEVAAQPGDVHDLDGLRLVGAGLAAGAAGQTERAPRPVGPGALLGSHTPVSNPRVPHPRAPPCTLVAGLPRDRRRGGSRSLPTDPSECRRARHVPSPAACATT